MPPSRPLLFAACLLLGFDAAAQDAPATSDESGQETTAEVIDLPLPWKPGQVLRYQTEEVETKTAPGKREKTRTSAIAEVKTVEAGKDGFLQHWRGYDTRIQVLEGDDSLAGALEEASRQTEDLALQVEADAEGSYRKLRNLDAVAVRMREVMRPVMAKAFNAGVAKGLENIEPAKRKEILDGIPAQVDQIVARMTEPKLLEQLLTNHIQTVLNFTGAELENDQAYVLETELENPTGGKPFPGKLTFGLYVDEDAPEDVWLEWTLEIDPVKGAAAVWDTVERLYGKTIGEAERKTLPAQISIVDKGFILFERATGLPEMYQNERTSKVAENASYERNRMRLLDLGHGHEWEEQLPQDTDPDLTGAEQDAQICADDKADGTAAIAACSRLLEQAGLEPVKQARWHAQRGWHRRMSAQYAEALPDYDDAIRLQPDNAEYLIARSNVQRRLDHDQAALADADRAIALSPKWAYARMVRGFALEQLKDWKAAVAAYDQGLELAPGDADIVDARCWAKAMAGDLAGGKADCDRALELDAESWNSYNSRGYIHYRQGDHAAALKDYDTALEHEPEIASSWYVRGMARRALGDEAGAKADIARAIELDAGIAERYAGYGVK